MNTKRQTVWLVSMLSLMVILSAYYLFTDSVGEIDKASDTEDSGQLVTVDEVLLGEHVDEEELGANGIVENLTDATLIDKVDEAEWTEQTNVEQTDTGEMDSTIPDKQILEDIQAGAKNGTDYLSALELKRNDALNKETERLLAITSDPKKSNEEMAKAQDELASIEDMQYRISDLEDQLMQDFENVVITEEKGKWKAVVQADKLERTQAVSIMDMMILNLQITPNKIAGVQFVQ